MWFLFFLLQVDELLEEAEELCFLLQCSQVCSGVTVSRVKSIVVNSKSGEKGDHIKSREAHHG